MAEYEPDVSGWCQRDSHDPCTGGLLSGTGSHWWCACLCHPEPVLPKWQESDEAANRALATWKAARSRIEVKR